MKFVYCLNRDFSDPYQLPTGTCAFSGSFPLDVHSLWTTLNGVWSTPDRGVHDSLWLFGHSPKVVTSYGRTPFSWLLTYDSLPHLREVCYDCRVAENVLRDNKNMRLRR